MPTIISIDLELLGAITFLMLIVTFVLLLKAMWLAIRKPQVLVKWLEENINDR